MNHFISKSYQNKSTILVLVVVFIFLITACNEKSNVEEIKLSKDWKLVSAKEISSGGSELSSVKNSSEKWIEATIPTTVLGALVDAGVYEDPFYGDNLAHIPAEPFENSWWFLKEFSINEFNANHEAMRLLIDGINYRANIWLNGQQIASEDTLFGAFRQFEIDITGHVKTDNILAFEIVPPKTRDFYMGFVDWAPTPPDNYMGIYREVRLKRTGKVALNQPFVKTDVNLETLEEAQLTIVGELTNYDNSEKKISVRAEIDNVQVSSEFTLKQG